MAQPAPVVFRQRIELPKLTAQEREAFRKATEGSRRDWEQHTSKQDRADLVPKPVQPQLAGQRFPNWLSNSGAFSMRDTREERQSSQGEYTKLPSLWGEVRYRGERLDQFDYEIFFYLRYLLDGEKTDTIKVTVQSIVRSLGHNNDTRKRRRVRSSLRRIGSLCEFYVKTKLITKEHNKPSTRQRKGCLLEITEIDPSTYQARIPPQWKECYQNGNYGWIDFQLHQTLTTPLEKALYRYIAGRKRGHQHKVQIADLRLYLGYKDRDLIAWRNFVYKLEQALATLKAKGIVQETAIEGSQVIWR